MIYLTYNDLPSGIYYSQVTDVCSFLNEKFNTRIRLVSIISIRNFWSNRNKIKLNYPKAIVVPMIPRINNWRWNIVSLFFVFIFLNSKMIITRGPFATCLALPLRRMGLVKKICFDARGAYDAELNEYDVVGNNKIKDNIFQVEKKSVLNSDFRIAVSNELVSYWRTRFNYNGAKNVVIPCTLNSKLFNYLPDEISIVANRKELGFTDEDIVLVYSGSTAGWQSLELVDEFLYKIFSGNQNIKILFLAKIFPEKMKTYNEYKNRIMCKWLSEEEVPTILACCDYGIIIREKSITNKVASPVKFAEYLASGLQIIISDGIGDYSDFILQHNCGIIFNNSLNLELQRTRYTRKQELNSLALNYFKKQNFVNQYSEIFIDL